MSTTPRAAALAGAGAVVGALGGAVLGLLVVLVHDLWWGLPLGAAATAAVLVAVPAGWTRRFAVAAGWVAVLAVLTPTRAEGDFLVSGDVRGYVLLGLGIAVLAGGVVGAAPRRRRASGPHAQRGEGVVDSGDVGPTP